MTCDHNALKNIFLGEKSVSIFLNIICRKGLGNFLCSLYRLQMTTKSCKKQTAYTTSIARKTRR